MELERDIPESEALDPLWAPLYKRLRERINNHVSSAVKRNIRYKRIAGLLNITVPLSALALTIVATSSFKHHEGVTVAVAITVTVLTGINSIIEPTRRYMEYVQSCIELHDLRFEVETWARTSREMGADQVANKLNTYNERISFVGRRMSGLSIARSML
ncbi:hypothetical protein [Mycobacteroides chelonae]|uniref:hypothetical protein n=1 Tax=Mycobacteroides chelonae TaxID=1774 RepID=UPI003AAE9244